MSKGFSVVIDARLKSLFVYPALATAVVLFTASAYFALLADHARVAWIGASIAALPLPLLFAWLKLGSPQRSSENLPFLLATAATGVMLSTWEQFIEGASGWAPTAVALFGASLFVLYVFWYSRFGRIASHALAVGERLPEFSLPDGGGQLFDSAELAGAPAVLLFYRGNWCPLCRAQIREIASRYQDLHALGVNVVLVSPQPDAETRRLAAEYDVPFRFLVDSKNEVSRELGIAVSNGVPVGTRGGYSPDSVMPTLIVTNAAGTIIFSDQTDNYRVRPEPDMFLAILRRSGASSK